MTRVRLNSFLQYDAMAITAASISEVMLIVAFLFGMLGVSVATAQEAIPIQPHQQFVAAKNSGDFASAVIFGRETLVLMEQQYGTESMELTGTLEMLGDVLVQAGELNEAILLYERVLRIKEREFGPDHPELVTTLDALVIVRWEREDFVEAESLLVRIVDIEISTYGESHEDVAITLNRLRDLYELTGKAADVARVDATIAGLGVVTRDGDLTAIDDAEALGNRRYTTRDGFATVRVFYGTNRARTGIEKVTEFYGGERGDLELGYLDVSIPETHKYGELETSSRWSIFTYTLGENALKNKYVLLLNVTPLDGQDFHAQLSDHIKSSPSDDIFVFVHGYNSSFNNAARRTAQLAYDLDFDGTPMMFSWPSQGSASAYTVDEAAVRVGGRKMAGFLSGLLQQPDAGRIHLIAHSMGNRALIEALDSMVSGFGSSGSKQAFDQVVFTAPDVDRDYFVDVIDNIKNVAKRITLYTSEKDVALRSSAILHGAPRAGLAGEAIITVPGMDTIDMSAVESDALGHAYYAVHEGALYDLFRLLWRGEAPQLRCGMNETLATDANFWLFNVEFCRGGAVLEAGMLLKRFGRSAREKVQRHLEALADDSDETAREEWIQILDRLDTLLETDEL